MKKEKELNILLNKIIAIGETHGDGESQYKHVWHTIAAIAMNNGYENPVDYKSIGHCIPHSEFENEEIIEGYEIDYDSYIPVAKAIMEEIFLLWEQIEKIYIDNEIDSKEFLEYYDIGEWYIELAKEKYDKESSPKM